MPPFLKRGFDNRQHRIVAFGIKNIAGADKNLHLIRLCSCLIEAFGQIVPIERHEIDDALPRDPQPLSVSYFERRAGIFRHDDALQDGH